MKIQSVKSLLKNELLKESKEYELDTINCYADGKNIELIKLTTENVRKVESMLKYNPDYPQFINLKKLSDDDFEDTLKKIYKEKDLNITKNKKDQKFKFSSIYYIVALMLARKEKTLNKKLYEYFIYAILRRISSENSTRTSIDSIIEISDNLCSKFSIEDLLYNLREPYEKKSYTECKYELIKLISKKTKADGKHNFSLATKFCHYMNFYIYLEEDCVNLFSIYDSVVKENLHYYYNYYVNNEKKDIGKAVERNYQYDLSKLKNDDKIVDIYREYQSMVDEIISKAQISRNGFDHLIWYTNKK